LGLYNAVGRGLPQGLDLWALHSLQGTMYALQEAGLGAAH